jgi:hypothetical protein
LPSIARDYPNKGISILLNIIVFLVAALRYNSIDYISYWRYYNIVTGFSNPIIFYKTPLTDISRGGVFVEPGFVFLAFLVRTLYNHFFVFVFIFALLSIFLKYYIYSKYSPFLILSILLYFSDSYFWLDIGQIRNALSSILVLYSIFPSIKREKMKFIDIIIIAMSIHIYAFVGIFIYFIPYI